MSPVRAVCLSWVVTAVAVPAVAQRATVSAETTSVRLPAAESTNTIVKSLKRGDVVYVQLTISSPEGNWCEVSETAQGNPIGLVLCGDLERERPDAGVQYREEVSTPPPGANRAGRSAVRLPMRRPAGPRPADYEYLYSLRAWENAFQFSDSQRLQVDGLAARAGVAACAEQYRAYGRKYARELSGESTFRAPGPQTRDEQTRIEQMVQDLNRFLHPCEMKMLSVLEALPQLMTAEQKQANAGLLSQFQTETAGRRKVLTSPDMYPGIR